MFLKLQPYRQQSIVVKRNPKLAFKFYGPFQVIQKISFVAYRLQLLAGAKMHIVFHESLLKKKLGPILRDTDRNNHCLVKLVAILGRE